MTAKRALVIGAGIAGPVAAIGLLRAGFEPVVYEAHGEGDALGAGSWLTVAVNGLQALASFELHQPVLREAFASTTIELLTGTGRVLGAVPLGGELADGTVTQTIKRAALYRVLAEEARRRGVRFEYGKRLATAENRGDGAIARFDDGTEAEGAVLVGADGVHSRVRAQLDPGAVAPRQTRMGNVGGFVPRATVDVAPGTYRMIFGKRAFFGYVVHPSGEVWWFANPPLPYPKRPDRPAQPDGEWLAELFADDRGPAAELVRATPGPLVFSQQYELPRVATWQRGAMVILGDAAHAASPTSGQGASLAIEDAVILARCLRDLPVPAALEHFVSLRRARAERVVAEAARMSSSKIPGPLGRFVRDLLLPLGLSFAARAKRDWLFGYQTDWSVIVA